MTGIDEQDLRSRLGSALETITPAAPPVSAVVRHGRAIRARRRIAAAVGVAALAAGIVVVPGLLRSAPRSEPVTGSPVVTVYPPGKESPAGLIAWGRINGRRWQIVLGQDGTAMVKGTSGVPIGFPANQLSGNDPVEFNGASTPSGQALLGPVRPDVTSVNVVLSDGAVLKLHPVQSHGHRYVALFVPEHVSVVEAFAYSRRGEIRHAIPWVHHGLATFVTWLRPGELAQQRATARIGSGVVAGTSWSATAYLGPWGVCVAFSTPGGGGTCFRPDSFPAISGQQAQASYSSGGPFPAWVTGTAVPSISFLRLTMSDGSTARVPVVRIGDLGYFAYAIVRAPRVLRWTALSASGQQVTSGTGPPL